MPATPTDLYRARNRSGVGPPRVGADVFPDANGTVGPEQPPLPRGPSLFADLSQMGVRGHWYTLPGGTELPEELGVTADGVDVNPSSPNPPSHHTVYPTVRLAVDRFTELFLGLPWHYGGKL